MQIHSSDINMSPKLSIVVIGRNEGVRLLNCIKSINDIESLSINYEIIYVDTNSSDGSADNAALLGCKVIRINPARPSAAYARNAGWRVSSGEYILFLDGDVLLKKSFVIKALEKMDDKSVAVVCGQRRELYPQNSIYNLVLDLDWIGSGGFVDSCGGDALFRRSVLEQTKGYDSTLIAGEEPDLCRRIRSEGLKVFRIDQLMTLHDLNITSLGQYWKRAVRTGYAYAEVSSRYRYTSDPLWRGESIRNFKQVSALVLMCLALIYFLFTQSALILGTTLIIFSLIFMLLINRSMRICSWKTNERSTQFLYVLHSYFQQLPIFQGQINYFLNQLLRQKKNLIEYKGN